MAQPRPQTRPRVYRRLLSETSLPLRPRVLSKATLTELSHVLENAVIDHDLSGAVFTGFQRSAHWLRELARYQRLVEPRARSVVVFAAGNLGDGADDAVVRVELGEDSPLVEEWFLVVLTTGFSAVLLGEETGEPFDEELDRRFETVWSFDHRVVTAIARFISDEVATFDPAVAARIDAALTEFQPDPDAEHLRDEVVGDLIAALESSRERFRRAALLEERAADELRRLDRSKNAFLTAVSHELRTPLTVVHGLALTLRRLGAALPDHDRADAERALAAHTTRLTALLEDLLDLDRLTRATLPVVPERTEVVAATRETVAELVGAQRVTITAPIELWATLDRMQYTRIVSNLVANALKYAPHGPVEAAVAPRDGGGVVLTVDDRGPGIPAADRQRVLEPFHRLDDLHPQPGTGVGLALVAEFAKLHGGDIEVTERPGGGARFVITLGELT